MGDFVGGDGKNKRHHHDGDEHGDGTADEPHATVASQAGGGCFVLIHGLSIGLRRARAIRQGLGLRLRQARRQASKTVTGVAPRRCRTDIDRKPRAITAATARAVYTVGSNQAVASPRARVPGTTAPPPAASKKSDPTLQTVTDGLEEARPPIDMTPSLGVRIVAPRTATTRTA